MDTHRLRPGADLGKLYFVRGSKHLQAVCRSREGCKTIATRQARALECQKDLARWLLQGVSCSREDHAKQA
eukprot:9324377-Alexandrium_andersonii.AAC.1